jgi:glycosyltransferase involved in cell wall biosynthesis
VHVLQSFKDYFPPTVGGIEGHINQIVNNMEDVQFTVLTSSRSRRTVEENLDGLRVIRAAELLRPASTPIMPSWRRLLKQLKVDAMHAHMPNPFGEICVLTVETPPVVASYHADIVGRPLLSRAFAPIQQQFFKRVHAIVVGSAKFADSAAVLAPHRSKLEVVPYGIDASQWVARPEKADQIRESHPGPLVLFLGRLVHYKGLDILVKAMAEVEATCLIVGDGPKRQVTQELVDSMGLGNKVLLLGDVTDAERSVYYHAADVFVLPSTSSAESYGISMLEAMACATPAISTEVGTATSWINQHRVTGLVVEPRSAPELAKAIRELLADASLRAELGAAAAERVATDFSQARMLVLLKQVYEDAVS